MTNYTPRCPAGRWMIRHLIDRGMNADRRAIASTLRSIRLNEGRDAMRNARSLMFWIGYPTKAAIARATGGKEGRS